MTRTEFKQGLADALKVEMDCLKDDMLLTDIEGWDSLGLVGTIALLSDVGVKAKVADIRSAKTVSDIIAFAGDGLKG